MGPYKDSRRHGAILDLIVLMTVAKSPNSQGCLSIFLAGFMVYDGISSWFLCQDDK